MRKLQEKALNYGIKYNLSDEQLDFFRDESYHSDYYDKMLNFFLYCNSEKIDVSKSCYMVKYIYDLFNSEKYMYNSYIYLYCIEYLTELNRLVEKFGIDTLSEISASYAGRSIIRFLIAEYDYIEFVIEKYIELNKNKSIFTFAINVYSAYKKGDDVNNLIVLVKAWLPIYKTTFVNELDDWVVNDLRYEIENHVAQSKFPKDSWTGLNCYKILEDVKKDKEKEYNDLFAPFLNYEFKNDYYSTGICVKNKDVDKINAIFSCKLSCVADIPAISIRYKKNIKNMSLLIEITRSSRTRYTEYISKYNNIGMINSEYISIYINKDTCYIKKMKRKNNKSITIPLTFKELSKLIDTEFEELNTLLLQFMEWADLHKYMLVKDMLTYVKQGIFIIPTTINEAIRHTSLNECLGQKYPVEKNYNRNDINVLYAVNKSRKYLHEASASRAFCFITTDILAEAGINSAVTFSPNKHNYRMCGQYKLFTHILISKLGVDVFNSEKKDIIKDYVYMCLKTKTKVKLTFKSFRKLSEEHDRITAKFYEKETPLIKIPKDTRFKTLNKLLPNDFEWIKTRRRLVAETAEQHHCVWSYADKINKDNCAIYSTVYEGVRYTIEFVIRDNKYIVNQIQPKYDRGAPEKVWDYVRAFVA